VNENRADGAAKVALGQFESAVGEALGDSRIQAKGAAHQVGGHVQEAAGLAQETIAQVAGRARKAASTFGEAYGRASEIAGKVDPFVQEKPYAALGLALAAGLLLGLLIAGGQPKIVYIKQKT
jgi:ElaB/YqjD/DUF883 family membrane-anchored ribosome-binding protein